MKAVEANSLNGYKLIQLPTKQQNADGTHEWNYLGDFSDFHYAYTGQAPDRSSDKNALMHIEQMHAKSKKAAKNDAKKAARLLKSSIPAARRPSIK